MLLDELMPKYDVIERHRTVVAAGTDTVYAALRRADLAGGPLAKLLLAVRAMPSALIALFRSPVSTFVELRAPRKPLAHWSRFVANYDEKGLFELLCYWPPRSGAAEEAQAIRAANDEDFRVYGAASQEDAGRFDNGIHGVAPPEASLLIRLLLPGIHNTRERILERASRGR